MRILEGNPAHAPDIDTIVVLQVAAQPYPGRLRKRAYPHPPAGQVGRRDAAQLDIMSMQWCWNRPIITAGNSTRGLPWDFACR